MGINVAEVAVSGLSEDAPGQLFCSRCGAKVARSDEPGRCYSDDCEPAEMDTHDEAVDWYAVGPGRWVGRRSSCARRMR